ncbi:MAG: hypothetical protein AMR96_06255 [Candidatus Adiutrix intracellularis]|jgi:cell wall-associated NlpC family hydrolase|nr:MAG: hypothetical protein AMR96_06255 [Candidatus Adiutrix intracellularis]MDR2826886.1 C40 family peptidase [Candidatus Adiutrix intracellularis]
MNFDSKIVRFLIPLLVALVLANGCGLFIPRSNLGLAAAKIARQYIGVPYQYGGFNPKSGFDCSGLTYYVYHQLSLELPRAAEKQARVGRPIKKKQLRPGDLIFFSDHCDNSITHVGLYLGDKKFIHAPGRGKKVAISSLTAEYFSTRYHSARRVS